jgi:hypothetical protein
MRLSRFLLNVTDPTIYIDHIDSNRLNNTRINLRLSNAVKNAHNRKKQSGTKSKYIGVRFDGKWRSSVVYNGKMISIGRDIKEIYAAKHRDLYILDNYPDEHYKLNFEWTQQDILKWKKILNIPEKSYSDEFMKISKNTIMSLLDDDLVNAEKLHNALTKKRKQRFVGEMMLNL